MNLSHNYNYFFIHNVENKKSQYKKLVYFDL